MSERFHHWPLARLGEVCEIVMGQSPASESYNDAGDGLPFYQGNADFGYRWPTPRVWCNSPTKIAKAGDILISVRAPIGALNFAKESCCIGRGVAALQPKQGNDSLFVYFALKCKAADLNARGTGSTFKAINKKALGKTTFPLPPLAEQRRIAVTLDSICGIIEKRKAQLAQLQQLVKSRFVEMFGEPITNPKEWPMSKIGEHLDFLTSGSRGWAKYYSDDGELFITIKNVKGGKISVNDVQHVKPPTGAETERTRVQEGDLLISITADLGRTGVVSRELADRGAYINQHLSCIRLNRKSVEPLFVAFYLESAAGKAQFEKKNQSAVKAGLNFEAIRSLRFYLPPLALQREFAAFVAKVDRLEVAVKKGLEAAERLYRQQLQEVFG